jgi:hypothetical protein
MATKYVNTRLTLLDRAKRTKEGKTVLPILEVMNEAGVDDFFMDVPFMEANMGLSHKIVRDTGMAVSTNRSAYEGTPVSKRNTQVVYEQTVEKTRRRHTDPTELKGLSDPKLYMRQEDEQHIRKLGEDIVNEFINGAETSGSEYCKGLLARMDATNASTLKTVASNGGSDATNNTSVLVVEWNTDKTGGAHGIYPSGLVSNAPFGIEAKDLGLVTIVDEDDSTKYLEVLAASFAATIGLAVGNNRKIGRLANVNSSSWAHADSFVNGGVEKLIEILNEGQFDRQRTRIYVNKTIAAQMDIYALNKGNVQWPTMEVFGRHVKAFADNIPVRVLENSILSNAQSVIT